MSEKYKNNTITIDLVFILIIIAVPAVAIVLQINKHVESVPPTMIHPGDLVIPATSPPTTPGK
jgi:hypothetical protein